MDPQPRKKQLAKQKRKNNYTIYTSKSNKKKEKEYNNLKN